MRCAIGTPPWRNNNFTQEIIEFNKTWQNSPDKINVDDGGFFHYFALWNTIHSLKPKYIIESGANRGVGTWFLRQAAGDSIKFVVISPQTPTLYHDKNAIYYSGDTFKDFNTINWQHIVDVKNTLIFFDDCQAAIRRIKEAQNYGFQHIVFRNISKQEYQSYVNDFKESTEIYAEFPPVWSGPTRFDINETMGIDVSLVYIKLKSYLLYLGNEQTNTGWNVHTKCLQYKLDQNKAIIVYGVGAGEDISWDIQMIDTFHVHSYIFDPTPKSIRTITPIINAFNTENNQFKNITFVHEGLSTKEGTLVFKLPENKEWVSMREIPDTTDKMTNDTITAKVNSLKNWMKKFGHNYLDVLKIDIEGSEYSVLEQFINENYLPFTQLLVEYHDRFFDVYKQKHEFVTRELINHGFQLVYTSQSENEMSYIKTKDLEKCTQKL